MNEIKVFDNLNLLPNDTYAENFVKMTKHEINNITEKFFTIWFRLDEANKKRYYKELGFDNIIDCARHYFGFEKTTTYDLMKLYRELSLFSLSDPPEKRRLLPDKYKGYSQSQLLVIASVRLGRNRFLELCNLNDTILLMKEAAKIFNNFYVGFEHKDAFKNSTSLQELVDTFKTFEFSDGKHYVVSPAGSVKKPSNNSVCPENDVAEKIEPLPLPVVLDEPSAEENSSEPQAEAKENISFNDKTFASLCNQSADALHRELVALFTKTPGISVIMRESLAKKCTAVFHDYLVTYKAGIRDILCYDLGRFDYTITLCNRKQALRAFMGNVVDTLSDIYKKGVANE